MNRLLSRYVRGDFMLWLIAGSVLANGLIIVGTSLAELIFTHGEHSDALFPHVPLLLGLTLIYLATLLRRRKRAAWLVILPVYACIFGFGLAQVFIFRTYHDLGLVSLARNILLPAIITLGLIHYRAEFQVKSDIQNFTLALRTSALLLVVALMYGVSGFILLDSHDFRQEISFPEAVHRTIDQFNITSDHELMGYTRRSRLFQDSLSLVSTVAVGYVFVSLFQPIRARLTDQTRSRRLVEELLHSYPSSSEDFFKIWPHDKVYFFNEEHTAALAYRVHSGVALAVRDPAGDPRQFPRLIDQFMEFCRVNDWLPSFIHTEPPNNALYTSHHFTLQKIGEEACLNLEHFATNTLNNKYFRQINNRFIKHGFKTEVMTPPHSEALIKRLRQVSNEWLQLPGRTERGFMMGYFKVSYIQQCKVMILRDEAGQIQAFMNQMPSLGWQEASYDLLRHTKDAPTNSNDFLLTEFIRYLQGAGITRLNLGLCPLAGLDNDDQSSALLDNALRFVYANSDRFYSFSGLKRFKSKYEPEWSSRYIAYRGGIRGFSRTLNALNKVMSKTR